MAITWTDLRPWKGDQKTAFEELCCQLAAHEPKPLGAHFIRKGAPDAGVECYWTLPDGAEHAWQAKFFLQGVGRSQWRQLDESVKTALEKHPRLAVYTVCLPLDRQDPRLKDQEWFLEAWNRRVEKWKGWARQRGMEVEFTYWGDHEIWERLSREEHRGRVYFWFNRELFSEQWFDRRRNEAIANAGERYTPALNVELPIAKLFEGLGRTEVFFDDFRRIYGHVKKISGDLLSLPRREGVTVAGEDLGRSVDAVLTYIQGLWSCTVEKLDLEGLTKRSEAARSELQKYLQSLNEALRASQDQEGRGSIKSASRSFEAHRLSQVLWEIDALAESYSALVANAAALALVGSAGAGKTHLFCDIATHRLATGRPTVLLLGEQFVNGEPWAQIVQLLGLSCSREEFLGALEASAEVRGAKALILIDALNEGEGKDLWSSHLPGMLALCEHYPWISVGVSIRSSYEDLVIPKQLFASGRVVRAVHHGFAEKGHEAMARFFSAFGLKMPSVPPLLPEFKNPLFLKLFCQGLKNKGLYEVPGGFHGITAIFDLFVNSVNERLARKLDFDEQDRLVHGAAEALAERMADAGEWWIERDQAKSVINGFLPVRGYERSLFRHMLAEGVLSEDRAFVRGKLQVVIRFTYERLGDHQIARFLLDRHLDPEDVPGSFSPGTPLGALVANEEACYMNRGLLEAFSLQLPERFGTEMLEVAPQVADCQPMRMSFVASLPWRGMGSFSNRTREVMNRFVFSYPDSSDALLDALLTVAATPGHPYNADFLHERLMKERMAERDAWWSIFLHEQIGAEGAVDRLVGWAWSSHDKSHLDDESVRLASKALAWFLTTSNRFLRDQSTKALVALLTPRIHILHDLLRDFARVDDPYVVERVLAAAYGCALRARNCAAAADLAWEVYRLVFKTGKPMVHVLARDYARGIIEWALRCGAKLKISRKKIRPPYRSSWPKKIPSERALAMYSKTTQGMPEEEVARFEIYHSTRSLGDFARYVIGTNSNRSYWSRRRLGEEESPSAGTVYARFERDLTPRQSRLWEEYRRARALEAFPKIRLEEGMVLILAEKKAHSAEAKKAEMDLRKSLRGRKRRDLDETVIPFLDGDIQEQATFDLRVAQRWVLRRVFELGWTVDRFGRFDRGIARRNHNRAPRKAERIGKKYQWIAWHEFLARLADNFEFLGRPWSHAGEVHYDGPWQIGARDIDPSYLLRSAPAGEVRNRQGAWWSTLEYNPSANGKSDLVWVVDGGDVPCADGLIEVTHSEDGSQWLVLETNVSWDEALPLEEDPDEKMCRRLWYQIRSYIVRRDDADQLFEWASQQRFTGGWMPESVEIHSDVFLGEMFWAPAFEEFWSEVRREGEWTRGEGDRCPCPVLVPVCQYYWGEGFDCSVEESVWMNCPTPWLVERGGWRWSGTEGRFVDPGGCLVAMDPSVETPGPGALLVRREAILRVLEENDCEILWTVLGHKQVLPAGFAADSVGWLEVNGAYRLREGKLEGGLWAEVKEPSE